MQELNDLKNRVAVLEKFITDLQFSHSIPLGIDRAFRERLLGSVVTTSDVLSVAQGGTGASTLTGILLGTGTSAISVVTPKSGQASFYVAPTSGVSPTTRVDINTGIITVIT